MRKLLIALPFIIPFLGLNNPKKEKQNNVVALANPHYQPVIVELFSSEGCSSCPPAEDVINKLIKSAQSEGKPIYPLVFHVDYWDYLGWKDVYANSIFTGRQQKYAEFFKLRSIYTPQAIVDGKNELVGSNENKMNVFINEELKKTVSLKSEISALKNGINKITINYVVQNEVPDLAINLAFTEKGIVNFVKSGENAGKTLHHENVVRYFETISLKQTSGTKIITLPAGIESNQLNLVAYLQNEKSMEIYCAQEIILK